MAKLSDHIRRYYQAEIELQHAIRAASSEGFRLLLPDTFHTLRHIAMRERYFFDINDGDEKTSTIGYLVGDGYIKAEAIRSDRHDTHGIGNYYLTLTERGWNMLNIYREVLEPLVPAWFKDVPHAPKQEESEAD